MTDKDETCELVQRAMSVLHNQIEKQPDPVLAFVPREQLLLFRANLQQMAEALQSDELPPSDQRSFGMAETIFDTWPLTLLGEAIIKAERAYQALQ